MYCIFTVLCQARFQERDSRLQEAQAVIAVEQHCYVQQMRQQLQGIITDNELLHSAMKLRLESGEACSPVHISVTRYKCFSHSYAPKKWQTLRLPDIASYVAISRRMRVAKPFSMVPSLFLHFSSNLTARLHPAVPSGTLRCSLNSECMSCLTASTICLVPGFASTVKRIFQQHSKCRCPVKLQHYSLAFHTYTYSDYPLCHAAMISNADVICDTPCDPHMTCMQGVTAGGRCNSYAAANDKLLGLTFLLY